MTVCVKCGEPATWVVRFRGMGKMQRFFCFIHRPEVGREFQKMLVEAIRGTQEGGK